MPHKFTHLFYFKIPYLPKSKTINLLTETKRFSKKAYSDIFTCLFQRNEGVEWDTLSQWSHSGFWPFWKCETSNPRHLNARVTISKFGNGVDSGKFGNLTTRNGSEFARCLVYPCVSELAFTSPAAYIVYRIARTAALLIAFLFGSQVLGMTPSILDKSI